MVSGLESRVLFDGLLIVGFVILFLGLRRRPEWSSPRCAKCGYDIRGLEPAVRKQCPECGADLKAPRGVRFGQYERSWKLMAIGGLIVLLPFMFVGGGSVYQSIQRRVTQHRSNESIIADLAANRNDSRLWDELMDRYYAGRISDEDVAATMDVILGALQSGAAGSPGSAFGPVVQQFIETAHVEGRIADDQLARLAEAYYKDTLRITAPAKVRYNADLVFRIDSVVRDFAGFTLLYDIREIRLDDTVIAIPAREATRFRSSDMQRVVTWMKKGSVPIRTEPGDHTIEFVIDCGATEGPTNPLSRFDGPGPVDSWPKTVFKDVQNIEMDITVMKPGESPITLVAPAEHKQTIIDGLHATALRVSPLHGQIVGELIIHTDPSLPVPVSFDVAVAVGGVEIEIGRITKNGHGGSRSGFTKTLRGFPDDAETVDVLFHPDPKAVESRSDWTEIWGEDIVIHDVPVMRIGEDQPTDEQ